MPSAIALPIRQQMIERRRRGATIAAIAAEFAISYWSVRTIIRRYRDRGASGLRPDYHRCGAKGCRYQRRVYRGALWLKRHHPSWGAGFIRVLLQQRWSDMQLPSERTLQRWFKAHRPPSLPTPETPTAKRQSAADVHQVWQLDATSHQRLADGSGASWVTLVDEASGAHLDSVAFPPLHL
jgi:hypothetical protein